MSAEGNDGNGPRGTGSGNWEGRSIHLIGVGGAGMSGLAWAAHRLGASVTGSDRSDSSYMERLRDAGIEVTVGHDPANVPDGAEIVVSTAIAGDNPELAAAGERGLRIRHRSELLAEISSSRRQIAVAGTHGKTTTTGMLTYALRELGHDPSFFIGGELPGFGPVGGAANSGWGEGEWVVIEADESDGSFLTLDPEVAVITNIEMDHHGRWENLAQLRGAFRDFAGKARAVVLPVADHELAGELIAEERSITPFDLSRPGPGELELAVPGQHNRLNARAAVGALMAAGFGEAESAAALSGFPGVKRRQEFKGECEGARVYDDYAHHPTEVRAALEAIREFDPERLIAVFQPHLYSRTKIFSQQFGAALSRADEIVVLDVYPAREEPVGPLAGVSGLDVLRAAADRAGGKPSYWARDLDSAERIVRTRAGADAVIATIGAGDITKLSDRLVAS
ncbi:MAG: UDP-N-acetylmuramate--L-alanine ligase [Solirubrobacterales bacterium]|nr:UDP-N-acetylmuramate--L-alanine ligase [Solirubrobacterales bacterium]MCB8914767.1 UDP-N-acetylmuramate--L-alanine ligase [Thermoleophilales bacterium]